MDRLRRTMMFLPGSNPAMVKEAYIYGADSIMFDLEDAVALTEKDTARFLVYNALKTIDYGNTETVVRVNPLDTPYGKEDIRAVVTAGVDVVRLPKTDSAQDIIDVEKVIEETERSCGREVGSTKMMAAIETPIGVLNAWDIARASKRLIAIALGAEDYVTNMKTKRYPDGLELLGARSAIIIAARAAGIYAIDTVYSNVDDEEGFRREIELIKQLGFDGKSVINPRQIAAVHEAYTPTNEEIEKSRGLINAAKEAEKLGLGVINYKGKMVDRPIIDRAERIITLAKAAGVYKEEEE